MFRYIFTLNKTLALIVSHTNAHEVLTRIKNTNV